MEGDKHSRILKVICGAAERREHFKRCSHSQSFRGLPEAPLAARTPKPVASLQHDDFDECRCYGIANLLIFHKLSDLAHIGDSGSAMRVLASSLLANPETRIVCRQEFDQLGPTSVALGLRGTEQS